MVGGEQAFVDARDWWGTPPPALDRDEALARLARRYLAGHGPAHAADLAKWAGIPTGQAKRGLTAIAADLVERPHGLVDLRGRKPAPPLPPPRLLGPFDPILHGWVSREPFVGAHQGVVTSNGLFRAVALVDGRVVATWGLAGGRVTLRPLEPIPPDVADALGADAGAVLHFLDLPDHQLPPLAQVDENPL